MSTSHTLHIIASLGPSIQVYLALSANQSVYLYPVKFTANISDDYTVSSWADSSRGFKRDQSEFYA